MEFMSLKKRSKEEIDEILKAASEGKSVSEICKKFQISEGSYYRILNMSRGLRIEKTQNRQTRRIAKLESQLKEREKEIALLKSALKKS